MAQLLTLKSIARSGEVGTNALNTAGELFNRAFKNFEGAANSLGDIEQAEQDRKNTEAVLAARQAITGINNETELADAKQGIQDSILSSGLETSAKNSLLSALSGQQQAIRDKATADFNFGIEKERQNNFQANRDLSARIAAVTTRADHEALKDTVLATGNPELINTYNARLPAIDQGRVAELQAGQLERTERNRQTLTNPDLFAPIAPVNPADRTTDTLVTRLNNALAIEQDLVQNKGFTPTQASKALKEQMATVGLDAQSVVDRMGTEINPETGTLYTDEEITDILKPYFKSNQIDPALKSIQGVTGVTKKRAEAARLALQKEEDTRKFTDPSYLLDLVNKGIPEEDWFGTDDSAELLGLMIEAQRTNPSVDPRKIVLLGVTSIKDKNDIDTDTFITGLSKLVLSNATNTNKGNLQGEAAALQNQLDALNRQVSSHTIPNTLR